MRVAKVAAQAKINLVLRVLARKTSGYHDISTVFQRIELADDIVVRVGGGVRTLDCAGPRLPSGGLGPAEENLAYRAATEYSTRKGWPRGFAIELTKHIPVGAGLGGGSADAGAVLRALNALAPEPMSAEELWSTASSLGSDVPFLTKDWPVAIGAGRGTELTNLSAQAAASMVWSVLIAVPSFGIQTADAYRWLDEDRASVGRETPPVLDLGAMPAGVNMLDMAVNDFQPVVERRHPELRRIRERLRETGARMAMLAGSGSCVFGLFDESETPRSDLEIDAEVIATRTSPRVVQVEVLE